MNKGKAVIHIEEVAQQRGKREEDHCRRDKYRAEISHNGFNGLLHIGSAGKLGSGFHTGAQAHQGGGTANQNGVDKHGQNLHQPLLDGVGYVGSRGGVGGRTNARFVGVKPPLDAIHHAGTRDTRENRLKIERVSEDFFEYGGNQAYVGKQHDQRNDNVQQAHEGDDGAGGLDHAAAAAQNAPTHENRQNRADDPRRAFGIVEAVHREGGLQVIGGQHVEPARIGENQTHGEQNGKTAVVKGRFNVIGRAAVAVAVFVPALVDLRQGAFHKRGGAADDGDQPHPKHRAVAAQTYRGGNTHDVSGAHAGGGGDHQRLK
ncbi:hypothetical protein SDC9_70264 [bioreactor metagenome]|uniref:Uncharacterized protein n=1 Tax=bioreactor metagenome TaxID=1076179 RepID=A0A644Y5R7_9ZZZZ